MKNSMFTLRNSVVFILPLLLFSSLIALCLFAGTIDLPFHDIIIVLSGTETDSIANFVIKEIRIPQICIAIFAGIALSVSGLLMQTLFSNPLADPSLLGINSGASLGVAVVMLFLGGTVTVGAINISGFILTVFAAFVGSVFVIVLLMLCNACLPGKLLLLITGVMISFIVNAMVSILNFQASSEGIQSFILWGMGTFSVVNKEFVLPFCVLILLGTLGVLLLIKPLNALLLGDNYASNVGVSVRSIHISILLITGILTATVTALCGPISFIGLAVPHTARLILKSSNHRLLIPSTIIWGANTALFCLWLSQQPVSNGGTFPINSITPILGVPICLYILLRRKV